MIRLDFENVSAMVRELAALGYRKAEGEGPAALGPGWADRRIETLEEAVISARGVFRDYETIHRAKGTPEADSKAETNARHAARMEAAIGDRWPQGKPPHWPASYIPPSDRRQHFATSEEIAAIEEFRSTGYWPGQMGAPGLYSAADVEQAIADAFAESGVGRRPIVTQEGADDPARWQYFASEDEIEALNTLREAGIKISENVIKAACIIGELERDHGPIRIDDLKDSDRAVWPASALIFPLTVWRTPTESPPAEDTPEPPAEVVEDVTATADEPSRLTDEEIDAAVEVPPLRPGDEGFTASLAQGEDPHPEDDEVTF